VQRACLTSAAVHIMHKPKWYEFIFVFGSCRNRRMIIIFSTPQSPKSSEQPHTIFSHGTQEKRHICRRAKAPNNRRRTESFWDFLIRYSYRARYNV